MTLQIEKETELTLCIDYEKIAQDVVNASLDYVECPYEIELNLILTDNAGIQEMNLQSRNIDAPTDVLSFPMLEYEIPGDFAWLEEGVNHCFHPDTGELLFGDIMISIETLLVQAKEYGHTVEREFAFLIAHSMLHLCGYDHMEAKEASVMEIKQKEILEQLQIKR